MDVVSLLGRDCIGIEDIERGYIKMHKITRDTGGSSL